jgi:hypothetical protein
MNHYLKSSNEKEEPSEASWNEKARENAKPESYSKDHNQSFSDCFNNLIGSTFMMLSWNDMSHVEPARVKVFFDNVRMENVTPCFVYF